MTDETKMRFLFDEGSGDGDPDPGGPGGGGEGDPGGAKEVTLPEGAIMLDKWRDALPEDLRAHESLSKIANMEGMARSLVSAQKMIGNRNFDRMVEVPDTTDADGVRALQMRLGLPEKAEDFKLQELKDAPETMGLDKPLAKAFTETAHKLGILPGQAQGLFQWFSDQTAAALAQQDTDFEAEDTERELALKAEWGAAFHQNSAAADFAVEKLGGQKLRDILNDAGVGLEPVVLNALVKVGRMLAEDRVGSDGQPDFKFGDTPEPNAARAKARELQKQAINTDDVFERRRLNAEAQKILATAFPETIKGA